MQQNQPSWMDNTFAVPLSASNNVTMPLVGRAPSQASYFNAAALCAEKG